MDARSDGLTIGLRRMNALLAWWGVSNGGSDGEIELKIARFGQMASDLQRACRETYSHQLEAALSTNDRLAWSFQEFTRCQRPNEVMAMESEILATLLEAASVQAKMWAELANKIQESCVAVARDAAEDLRGKAAKPSATTHAETRHRTEKRHVAEQAYARSGPAAEE